MKHNLLQRGALRAALFVLLLSVAGTMKVFAQPHVFSVSENTQVVFSPGNLQYQAITNTWRFAFNQWDYVGADNANASETYYGWIDLFGWGTSGWDNGNIYYQPWSTNYENVASFGYGPTDGSSYEYDLSDAYGYADWGHNPIQNGGNTADQWRTLTHDEWEYLFNTRTIPSGIRYTMAKVSGVNGVILLPDDWNAEYFTLSNTNTSNAHFSSNTIDADDWTNSLESHGAVFLPAAGTRTSLYIYNVGSSGAYWSSSHSYSSYAWDIYFHDSDLVTGYSGSPRYEGLSVRLVRSPQNCSFGINASPSPVEGGAVSGAGAYQGGTECTLTATASAGYAFANWTEDGIIVSTDATYTFVVSRDRNLVAIFVPIISEGGTNGVFSVNADGGSVVFSQGNLQYIGSAETPYWKFAEHQWDYLGDNGQGSDSPNVDRDLFGWGTSGYNHGAVCYKPWSTSQSYSDYYAYGNSSYNLFDQTGQADWGYNAISNGGNQEDIGWRTLTKDEWGYLFNTRSTPSGVRYAKAKVNNVNGVILLPDDWNANYYTLNSTNNSGANYTANTITATQWATLEQHGAVFLPAAGYRDGTSVNFAGFDGGYWSSSCSDSDCARGVYFYDSSLTAGNNDYRYGGQSVRLVFPSQGYSFAVNASPSPAEGGAVSGAGAYQAGAECTLTATASAGYVFANWTENGAIVSTDATYTFVVSRDRNLVAIFVPIISEGGTNGVFSVNADGGSVVFSQGNLQYIGSAETPYWKFAEHQWDYLGDNGQGSDSPHVDRDLFGWGTSGYNHGANCYQPWSTSESYDDYHAYGNSSYNLFDQTGQADWGYNAISNGGNQENIGWRTLTTQEWQYLFNTRSTPSGIRYAKAKVNNVNGVILLPDDWNASYYTLNSTNSNSASYTTNTITATQWASLEQFGAVFLPAAGLRKGTSVLGVGSYGSYWSSSSHSYSCCAWFVYFYDSDLYAGTYDDRCDGPSVRLVFPSQGYSFAVNASPSPVEGGAVSGAGAYQGSAECTLTATASAGYAFANWTEDGIIVSTDASYTFVVLRDRDLVANFLPQGYTFAINAASSPLEGGAVIGAGGYHCNDTCTLTAIPNEGYVFLYWMDDVGQIVSRQVEYSFAVTEDRTLTAWFVEEDSLCEVTFDLYDSYGDGYTGNYLVVDYGNGVEQLTIENGSHASYTRHVAQGSQVELSWILSDYPEDCSFTVSYEGGETILEQGDLNSDFSYVFEVDCSGGVPAQTLELSAGWNWVSFNVEITMNDLKAAIVAANPDAAPVIKSKDNGQTSYNGAIWVGALRTLDLSQMYEIKVANACTVTLEGIPVNPADHPATIKKGANWIAYPLDETKSVANAFAGFPVTGDNVKSKDGGQATWNGVMWLGALKNLVPGTGYIYNSKATGDKTLTF